MKLQAIETTECHRASAGLADTVGAHRVMHLKPNSLHSLGWQVRLYMLLPSDGTRGVWLTCVYMIGCKYT
jgi:hypothetical protein